MSAQCGDSLHTPNRGLVLLSVLVLAVCLFYTYTAVYLAPYPGLDWGADWTVTAIEPCEVDLIWCDANQDTLQVGDQMLAVGDLTYSEYQRDKTRITFGGYDPGEAVSITFCRDREERTVDWRMLGPTDASRVRRLDSLPIYIPFWLAGTLILLLMRPRDLRWWLLVLFNYLTAIWLAVGAYSLQGVACASPIQQALAWLWMPIYLHLHLIVPSPLPRHHWRYSLPVYAGATVLAILELFQVLPGTLYYMGPLLAFLSSLGLLIFRLLAGGSADKLAVRLMLIGAGLAFGPVIVLWFVPRLSGASLPKGLTLYISALAIPLLPFFYIYAIYKRRLGTLEFRANRLLSSYSFFLLYATIFALVFSIGSQWLNGNSVVFGLVISTLFVIAALPLRARFQRLIDRLAYGARHDPDEILRLFTSRIATALDRDTLAQLLADEVTPSLLIRQSALLLTEDGTFGFIYARGIALDETSVTGEQVRQLIASAGQYRLPVPEARDELGWVRLVIPLEMREKTVGVWLFGRRDPDDYYPHNDIVLLTSLARQVAVAIENSRLFQAERGQRELAEALAAAAAAVDSALQLDPVLDRILEQVERVVAGDAFSIMLIENGGVARIVRWWGHQDLDVRDFMMGLSLPIADFPTLVRMVRTGEPVIVGDTATDPDWVVLEGQEWLLSYVGAPIQVGGHTVGFLNVDGTRPGQFHLADAQRLQAFTNHAAVAIENAYLYAEQRRRAEEASLLLEIAGAINSTLELDHILQEVAVRAARACQAERCTVLLLDESGENLHPIMSQLASGESDPEERRLFTQARYPRRVEGVPEAVRAIEERRPLFIPDVRASSIPRRWVESFDMGCLLLVPVISRERVVGLMALDRHEVGSAFTDKQVKLAMTIGGQAAVAIENAGLHREQRDYARQLEQRVMERTAELQAQYAWLRAILRSSTDGIIVANMEGEILEANPVVTEWLTHTLSPEDAGRLQETVRGLVAQADQRSEAVLELTELDLELTAAPILEPGMKGAAVVITAHDVSHLKALDRMKSRFVSDVSHELRTPITTIKLYAALVQRSSPQKMHEYLEVLVQEADRQVKLVEDILQISRIDAGRLEMEPHLTSLNELAAEVVASHRATAEGQGLALSCQLAKQEPVALVDPNRIMQVLDNLVANSIHYTLSGGEVMVSVSEEGENGHVWAVVKVTDSGIGIPQEELPLVFERFFRGERARLLDVPGTGLGLAISREIVELHGGRMTVESREDVGSTFTIWLPVA
jgi:signal transduction histidine kinase